MVDGSESARLQESKDSGGLKGSASESCSQDAMRPLGLQPCVAMHLFASPRQMNAYFLHAEIVPKTMRSSRVPGGLRVAGT